MAAKFPFYRSATDTSAVERPQQPSDIEAAPRQGIDRADRYIAGDDLEAAVNAALLLGMPLVVSGKPGSGKTQLGYAVGYALGYPVLKFNTKSTSQAKDIFYTFDIVGRFHASQIDKSDTGSSDPRRFISYQALGVSILLSQRKQEVADFLPLARSGGQDATLLQAMDDRQRTAIESGWEEGGFRSVVIIDEVDKAPRDFPNDILNEIEQLSFTVSEFGTLGRSETPRPPDDKRPFLVFTSNSEKQLPDAFLRRCVYHNIEDPNRERLKAIVRARLGPDRFVGADTGTASKYTVAGDEKMAHEAIGLYLQLRDGGAMPLRKPPGVSELLSWLQALAGSGADLGASLVAQPANLVSRSLTLLVKTQEDREAVMPRLTDLLRSAGQP